MDGVVAAGHEVKGVTAGQEVKGVTAITTIPERNEYELTTVGGDMNSEEVVQCVREDIWGEASWEGERPPTPPLVQEMQEQEEESMEWESVDREEILKETQTMRDKLSQAMDKQENDMVEEKQEERKVQELGGGKALVVVDTNVLISSLSLVIHLLDEVGVNVVIPWMVVQETD